MQRPSQQDADGTIWTTASLRLGGDGLDLRRPSEPPALADLVNARFLDERTIRRRDGHVGHELVDASSFPALQAFGIGDWLYGHGNRFVNIPVNNERSHCPICHRAATTFKFGNNDVVWTGDRLLAPRSGGLPALGDSTYWWRNSDGAAGSRYYRGIPAFMPSMTDSFPPSNVTGNYVQTCLTTTQRIEVNADATTVNATVISRDTGAIVSVTKLNATGTTPVTPVVVNSGGIPVAIWRNSADKALYMSWWSGVQWSAQSTITADTVDAFAVATDGSGFHVLWRSTNALKIGRFAGRTNQNSPYTYGTAVGTGTPSGPVALGVAPSGELCVAWSVVGGGVYAAEYSASGTITAAGTATIGMAPYDGTGGLGVVSRALRETTGHYEWVVYTAASSQVLIRSVLFGDSLNLATTYTTRYNSTMTSKPFRVGDEVFCWLRSANAGTHYLLAGVYKPVVAGYADREEAIVPNNDGSNVGLAIVALDPLSTDGTLFTWLRKYTTGQTYDRAGNVRVAEMNFLPAMTVAHFGRSVYLSGSAVKNYDGQGLADAGFQDYPTVASAAKTTGGAMAAGRYYFRVYPVRYNAQGERFQGAALTSAPVDLTTETKVNLTINTLPSVSTEDVILEVYRTEAGGTTFYYDGYVANDLTAATVSYSSTVADATLITHAADPHAAGIGNLSELEEFGPLGCTILVSCNDRLWGAGGQVPAGTIQFSKLKENGEGAGFDDLAGYQEVDTEGGGITSLIGLNDSMVVFQREKFYVIGGVGPDNYGQGAFSVPQLVLAAGASTHFGTTLAQPGVLYWGEDGPLLLDQAYRVNNISLPIRPLTTGLEPTGVRVDLSSMEVVWYTAGGDAVLWNYDGGSRWARWTNLPVAGCSNDSLVSPDGILLNESADAVGDDGRPFAFAWRLGNVRPEQLLQGHALIRRIGVLGDYLGTHKLRVRVFYDGAPLWSEVFTWDPKDATWLTSVNDVGTLTPTQVDALNPTDHSGSYGTNRRLQRQDCHYFQVEVSDISSDHQTYVPFEMAFELGARPGLARVPVNTFTP